MLRPKVIVIVAIALLFLQLPCVAACANHLCEDVVSASIPPCHRHHNHSQDRHSSCVHQTMVSTAAADHVLHTEFELPSVVAPCATCSTTVLLGRWFRGLDLFVASPPHLESLSSVVLRI
jgi:hypothetical protein